MRPFWVWFIITISIEERWISVYEKNIKTSLIESIGHELAVKLWGCSWVGHEQFEHGHN